MPRAPSFLLPVGSRRERWWRIAHVAWQRLLAGPGPFWRAVRSGLFSSLPRRVQFALQRGSLRRFRAVADLQFRGPEPGVETPGLVSVILPVYDQAALLGEAVASVLSQSYTQLELVVLDDGSRDDVAAALAPFAADRRLRVLRQPNQGLPNALASAFECATGEFHTWTSADNVMLPHMLARLVAFLREHPEHAMVFADYELIDDAGRPLRGGDFRIFDRVDARDRAFVRIDRPVEGLHRRADNFVGPCFLYRGRATRLLAPYGGAMGLEDYDYWLRLNRLLGIAHLGKDDVLYRYRVHDNTLSARARALRLQEEALALMARERRRARFFATGDTVLDALPAAPSARGLLVLAAGAAAAAATDLPPGVSLALTFDDVAAAWRFGARVRRPDAAALCANAEIARRLAVFTGAVFVAADAQERLELALRWHNDRTFRAVDGGGAARAVPSPLPLGQGPEPDVRLVERPPPHEDEVQAEPIDAWLAHRAEWLAALDTRGHVVPERLVLVPPSVTLADARAHVRAWLTQGGTVPGIRRHLERAGLAGTRAVTSAVR